MNKPKWPYLDQVDNSETDWSRAYNTEIARIFRVARVERDEKITDGEIGAIAHMHPITVGRLLNDKRKMDLNQFFGLAKALGLDAADVATQAREAVENNGPTSKP